jgi:hypothetical protein
MQIGNGDTLMIPNVLQDLAGTVVLQWHVQRPRPREWRTGMRLSDLIPSLSLLKPGTDGNDVLIHRKNHARNIIDTISADLEADLANPQSNQNVQSGGPTWHEKLIYIVRASGSVVTAGGSWFRRDVRLGDSTWRYDCSPLGNGRIRPLTFWTNVSEIFYQAAIAIAAIRTFDN